MKERPIIFSTEMVRAILDGRKTQTRRVIKPQPYYEGSPPWNWKCKQMIWSRCYEATLKKEMYIACPYGQVGDRLWVREAFFPIPHTKEVWYKADDVSGNVTWKPSIHMPRRASRILLEITKIRVERLQEITEEDARAECAPPTPDALPSCLYDFRVLWNSLNAKRGYGWETNPWVWCLKFRRIENG